MVGRAERPRPPARPPPRVGALHGRSKRTPLRAHEYAATMADLSSWQAAKCEGAQESSVQLVSFSETCFRFQITTPPRNATYRLLAEVPRALHTEAVLCPLSWEQLALLGAFLAGVAPDARDGLPSGYRWHQALGMPSVTGGSHEAKHADHAKIDCERRDGQSSTHAARENGATAHGAACESDDERDEGDIVHRESVWRRMRLHFPDIPLAGRRFRKVIDALQGASWRMKVKVCPGTVRRI